MINVITLVGRNVNEPLLNDDTTTITLAFPRSFKNEEGIYETDFIPVILKGKMAQTTCEYCRKGDIVGVKGMVASCDDTFHIIADKISFLSSNYKEEE